MPLPRLIVTGIAIIALFSAGYFGRAAVQQSPDRGIHFVEIWAKYCLPMMEGHPMPAPQGSVRLKQWPDEHEWGFHHTYLKLRVSDNDCTVSDVLQHLTPDERLVAETAIREQLNTMIELPYSVDLAPSMNWDLFLTWREAPDPKGATWSASVARFAGSGEHATTSITLSGRGVQLTALLP